ncbi:hypothetical protein SK128_025236 [Halocaridina rubra]|uniref:Methyltransferase FkbM domain-containing protein n=1 Tax=Halocaridina rubra TaxID=373956 RepID=A0AAN8WJY6_HALRR
MITKPRHPVRRLTTYGLGNSEFPWEESLEIRLKGPLMADDSNLIRVLREEYLTPPSSGEYNLMLDKEGSKTAENYNVYRIGFGSWMRIYGILDKLFGDQPSGVFLEAGALDGEFISNTLFLERDLGWSGLLIEADPFLYKSLPGKNRKAWSSHSCISPANYAQKLTLETYHPRNKTMDYAAELMIRSTGNLEGVKAPAKGQMGIKTTYEVQCFPLLSYLLALNTTTVHYISLDVEGAEASILLTLPWDQISVTVWNIEHRAENTGFRDFYLEPGGIKPIPPPPKEKLRSQGKPNPPKRVVYITEHDPAGGKDDYLVLFMKEKGYALYDYWDGDYTFIRADSALCEKHCHVI